MRRMLPIRRTALAGGAALWLIAPGALAEDPAPQKIRIQVQPAAPAPASESPPASAGSDAKGGEKKPTVTLGASWSDKPRHDPTRRYWKRKVDPDAPQATFPGFRMLPDGTSQIWVTLSKKASVEEHAVAGRVTYVIAGAWVPTWNNTHPLVTTHFNTPLTRARLVPAKEGVELVVELREEAKPAQTVEDGPRGTMVVKVTLPRPAHAWVTAEETAPLGNAKAAHKGKEPGTAVDLSKKRKGAFGWDFKKKGPSD